MTQSQIYARHRFCLWLIDMVTDGYAITPDSDGSYNDAVECERRTKK